MTNDTKYLCEFIRKETGLYVSDGAMFGGNGNYFIRLNYACPKARLEDGLQRLKKGILEFQSSTSA
ncbi:hypothetical protein GCM10008013_18510 [Paenibacillus segetis]|uniref:Uncharacterized protein n=1 Tax=Paenibacillus segetis TaxID=1325360 RepID=A0ABQ1YDY6_9BACL|nr:hypothetical protein GCM10008013_18510 [Paenibacillus segetis]